MFVSFVQTPPKLGLLLAVSLLPFVLGVGTTTFLKVRESGQLFGFGSTIVAIDVLTSRKAKLNVL
jgi:hypothetical protein